MGQVVGRMARGQIELTLEEEYIFKEARRTGDVDLFTDYFCRLPGSGTMYTPEDRVEQYTILYSVWSSLGKPDESFPAAIDDEPTEFRVRWDNYYGDYPMFLYPHGFRMMPWLREFLVPSIPLGIALTGTGTGKTAGLAIWALACCALYPGFRMLNVAPSKTQAHLMLGEVEKWCGNTKFRRFIRETRGINPLWAHTPHATLAVEVEEGFPSTFICQTVKGTATGVLGGERDAICCDEAQLLMDIDEAIPILATRMRGTRSTGDLRWGMLRFISNPGRNPELTALIEQYRHLQDTTGEAIVLEEIHSSANVYVTKRQLAKQGLSLASRRDRDRWHGGVAAAVYDDQEISEDLLEMCRDADMTQWAKQAGDHDDILGLRRYEMPYKSGHTYVVAGDAGKGTAIRMSTMNIPCVMVFDIDSNDSFLRRPIELVALYWIDGGGSYEPFIETMQRAMLRYQAAGYYDATNIQTAFEDIRDAAFDGWPTTPVFFSGGKAPKRWALAIVTKLMSDALFRWPYIKALWHQARIYDVTSRRVPDDLIATLLVFGLALRVENALWDKLAKKYHWDIDRRDSYEAITRTSEGPPIDDRFARMVSPGW